MSKTKTFTVTEFIKDNTFAVTSRSDTEQIALIAAYTAAGYTATVLGTGLEAGPAKTLKGEAITILQAAGKTLVNPGDRPAAQHASPEVRAARKAARLAARPGAVRKAAKAAKAAAPAALMAAAPKAAAPKAAAYVETYEEALVKKKKEINDRLRNERIAARQAAPQVVSDAPKMLAARTAAPKEAAPVDPAKEAAHAARKAAREAAKAARKASKPILVRHPKLTSVTTVVVPPK